MLSIHASVSFSQIRPITHSPRTLLPPLSPSTSHPRHTQCNLYAQYVRRGPPIPPMDLVGARTACNSASSIQDRVGLSDSGPSTTRFCSYTRQHHLIKAARSRIHHVRLFYYSLLHPVILVILYVIPILYLCARAHPAPPWTRSVRGPRVP